MAFTLPNANESWATGEVITATKMNNIKGNIDALSTEATALEAIASSDYDASTTYNIGDYCIYNHKLFRCKSAGADHTPPNNGSNTYWQETNVMSEARWTAAEEAASHNYGISISGTTLTITEPTA